VTRGVIVAPRHRRILELRLRQDQAAAAAVGPNPGHRLRTSRASATDAEYAPKLTEHVERGQVSTRSARRLQDAALPTELHRPGTRCVVAHQQVDVRICTLTWLSAVAILVRNV
jgi:hypothetical protein